MSDCCKCKRPVPPGNDSSIFDIVYHQLMARGLNCVLLQFTGLDSLYLHARPSTHLMPVVENGKVVCPGSPSRAQYFEGQPRDTRPQFPYNPDREELFRTAYNRYQAEVAPLFGGETKELQSISTAEALGSST